MVKRSVKLAQEIKRSLSHIISNDLREKVSFFSISHINLTNDLSHAKVFISFFGPGGESEFDKILKAKGFIRSKLAKSLTTKHVPELTFSLDESLQEGDSILNKINNLDVDDED
jgi:ribosome-binding factor A